MKIATMAVAMTFLLSGTWAFAQGTAGGPTSLSGTGPSNIGGQEPWNVGNRAPPARVAGRQTRRAVYGAGVVGAGAAAVGTAGAVAATSPNWGWGGNPYRTGYYAGGPYYGESVRGARAAYYGGYPSPAWGGVSNSDREMYIKNLHDSGYNVKNNFNAAGNVSVP
ncbi:hypothetical protein SAMN05444169_4425 [Bradyrhizobium erythrophlei]|jgi:hypothetical protein|uniref:Uncharacterized protein n=1 Tax=Bradyrhizobium erythrophlei TaxID=1437360 RepID=A0A1M5N5I2_9BRAD|nr:hypothetical protein SAMN05444169_4425 [Bradyrhizobium erythrophlei]